MPFDRLRRFLKNIQKLDPNKLVSRALDNKLLQAQILDLNTLDQLYEKGIDSEGRSLGPYAPFTIQYKQTIAAMLGNDTRSDHITLKDTGEFYASFRYVPLKDGGQITADTAKEGGVDLAQLYGPILGLTDESKNQILPELTVLVRDQIRTEIST